LGRELANRKGLPEMPEQAFAHIWFVKIIGQVFSASPPNGLSTLPQAYRTGDLTTD